MSSSYANLYDIRGNATKLNLEDNQQVDFYSSLTDSIYNVKGQNKDFPNSTQRENIVNADGLSFIGQNPYLKCICPLKCPACYQNKVLPTIPLMRPTKKEDQKDDKLPSNIGPGGDGPGGKPAGGPKGKPVEKQTEEIDDDDDDDDDKKKKNTFFEAISSFLGNSVPDAQDDAGQAEAKKDDDDDDYYDAQDDAGQAEAKKDDDDDESRGTISVLHPADQQVAMAFGNALFEFAQMAVSQGITNATAATTMLPDFVERIREMFPQHSLNEIKEDLQPILVEVQNNTANNYANLGTVLSDFAKTAAQMGYTSSTIAVQKLKSLVKNIQEQFPALTIRDIKEQLKPYFVKSEEQLMIENNAQLKEQQAKQNEINKNEWIATAANLILNDPKSDYEDIIQVLTNSHNMTRTEAIDAINRRKRLIQELNAAEEMKKSDEEIKDFRNLIKEAIKYVSDGNFEESDKIRDELLQRGYTVDQLEAAFKDEASKFSTIRNIRSLINLFIATTPSQQRQIDMGNLFKGGPYQTATDMIEDVQINPLRQSKRAQGSPVSNRMLSRQEIENRQLQGNKIYFSKLAKSIGLRVGQNEKTETIKMRILEKMRKDKIFQIEEPYDISGSGIKRKHPVWKKILKGSQLAGNGSKRIKLLLS